MNESTTFVDALLGFGLALEGSAPQHHPQEKAILKRFDRAWSRGRPFDLKPFLASVPELDSFAGTKLNLILLEYYWREDSGEAPTVEEFALRFPDLPELPSFLRLYEATVAIL